MTYKQDEYIKQYNHTAQIANTIRHSRYFLVSILIICLYIFSIYQIFYKSPSLYFNIWFIFTEVFVSLCWLMSTVYFKPEQYSLMIAHRWLQFQCFSVGTLIASGIFLIFYYLTFIYLQLLIKYSIIKMRIFRIPKQSIQFK